MCLSLDIPLPLHRTAQSYSLLCGSGEHVTPTPSAIHYFLVSPNWIRRFLGITCLLKPPKWKSARLGLLGDRSFTVFEGAEGLAFPQPVYPRLAKIQPAAGTTIARRKSILSLRKHQVSIRFNRVQQGSRNPFNKNHLESARFHKLQQALSPGSGPGGRWFKSTRPDYFFPITYSDDRGPKPGPLRSTQVTERANTRIKWILATETLHERLQKRL